MRYSRAGPEFGCCCCCCSFLTHSHVTRRLCLPRRWGGEGSTPLTGPGLLVVSKRVRGCSKEEVRQKRTHPVLRANRSTKTGKFATGARDATHLCRITISICNHNQSRHYGKISIRCWEGTPPGHYNHWRRSTPPPSGSPSIPPLRSALIFSVYFLRERTPRVLPSVFLLSYPRASFNHAAKKTDGTQSARRGQWSPRLRIINDAANGDCSSG